MAEKRRKTHRVKEIFVGHKHTRKMGDDYVAFESYKILDMTDSVEEEPETADQVHGEQFGNMRKKVREQFIGHAIDELKLRRMPTSGDRNTAELERFLQEAGIDLDALEEE
jgi:hypothetical protein